MQTPIPPPTSGSEQLNGADLVSRPLEVKKIPTDVKSVDLFQGQKSIAIEHNGTIYRLQTTKLGKLILTK